MSHILLNVRFYFRSQDVADADSTVGFPVVDDAFPVAGRKKVRPQVSRKYMPARIEIGVRSPPERDISCLRAFGGEGWQVARGVLVTACAPLRYFGNFMFRKISFHVKSSTFI